MQQSSDLHEQSSQLLARSAFALVFFGTLAALIAFVILLLAPATTLAYQQVRLGINIGFALLLIGLFVVDWRVFRAEQATLVTQARRIDPGFLVPGLRSSRCLCFLSLTFSSSC